MWAYLGLMKSCACTEFGSIQEPWPFGGIFSGAMCLYFSVGCCYTYIFWEVSMYVFDGEMGFSPSKKYKYIFSYMNSDMCVDIRTTYCEYSCRHKENKMSET